MEWRFERAERPIASLVFLLLFGEYAHNVEFALNTFPRELLTVCLVCSNFFIFTLCIDIISTYFSFSARLVSLSGAIFRT